MDYSDLNEIFNSTNSNGDVAAVLGLLGIFIVFLLIIALIAIIFRIVSRWVFFKKCGEDGWKALIPFYTDYTLVKVSGLNWWWFLLLIASAILSSMQSSVDIISKDSSSAGVGAVLAIVSVLSLFASLASIFARINYSVNISKKFGKSGGYAALIVFFEPIMLLILGISKKETYDEKVEVSPNGIFGASTTTTSSVYCPDCGTKVDGSFCPDCGKKVR